MSRPFALDPLFRALTTLPGLGPRNSKLVEKLVSGPKVLDLLWHMPVDFVDRRFSPDIASAPDGRVATMEIEVMQHKPAPRKGLPHRVTVRDTSGTMSLVFFHANRPWIEKQLKQNEKRVVSGRVEYYQGSAQMVHPDFIVTPEERADVETVEPIYPLTAGVTNKTIGKAMGGALKMVPALPEWLDESFKSKNKWSDWNDVLRGIHTPDNEQSIDPNHPARARIAYDELLANQLTLALVRKNQKKKPAALLQARERCGAKSWPPFPSP